MLGSAGASVTLTGTGLVGTDIDNTNVTIGGVACSVTSVTNTAIMCDLGPREGGPAAVTVSYMVMVLSEH